ncbi:hypothetical protein NDU88_004128 [Pleurodeles waltl]|uniref:Gypsy retrotransposon integrase-like protein 1 n=1 Tax=Pleurodeles waltl TaxID=8319 RepID=A0AAV7QBC8_PLEWA|nr:hypothetical protein NDU88_004128 [Pleurodeles waltl]
MVIDRARPLPIPLDEVVEATKQGECLQIAVAATRSGDWHQLQRLGTFRMIEAKARHRALFNVRNELSVSDEGCLLRGLRLVIPSSLTGRAVSLAHGAHQGIVKSKTCLRNKVLFPGLDQLVEDTVKGCLVCQASGTPDSPARVIMEDGPSARWQRVSADFGSLSYGSYMLVAIDDYSHYPEVELV